MNRIREWIISDFQLILIVVLLASFHKNDFHAIEIIIWVLFAITAINIILKLFEE